MWGRRKRFAASDHKGDLLEVERLEGDILRSSDEVTAVVAAGHCVHTEPLGRLLCPASSSSLRGSFTLSRTDALRCSLRLVQLNNFFGHGLLAPFEWR